MFNLVEIDEAVVIEGNCVVCHTEDFLVLGVCQACAYEAQH